MKTNLGNFYGVFIMHEQLNLRGLLAKEYDTGLDVVWERCMDEYFNRFLNSEFSNQDASEYDCISRYVQDLATISARKEQARLAKLIRDKVDINIVTCGECGDVILHERNYEVREEIQCPSCFFKSDISDFPDLY